MQSGGGILVELQYSKQGFYLLVGVINCKISVFDNQEGHLLHGRKVEYKENLYLIARQGRKKQYSKCILVESQGLHIAPSGLGVNQYTSRVCSSYPLSQFTIIYLLTNVVSKGLNSAYIRFLQKGIAVALNAFKFSHVVFEI